jgi:hypothetical protein
MKITKSVMRWFVAAAILAVAASCVESRHPLSDEKTSKIDERLIGTWQLANDSSVWKAKRSADTKNALEVEITDASGTGRAVLFATMLKSKNYASTKDLGKDAQKDRKGAYDIYQYRVLDNDTIEAWGMDAALVKKAILDKKLVGEINDDQEPVITDSGDGIARYIEANADACFPIKDDNAMKFKRIKQSGDKPPASVDIKP